MTIKVTASVIDLDFTQLPLDSRISFTRGTTATYFDQDGVMKNAAAGIPRIAWNSSEKLGLMIEDPATNYCLRSAEMDNALWTKTQLIVTPNSALAPDGTMSADRLVETGTNSVHKLIQTVTVPHSNLVTFSVYVKADTKNRIKIEMIKGALFIKYTIDLVNGGSGFNSVGFADYNYKVDSLESGWKRILITGKPTSTANNSLTLGIYLLNNSYQDTYTGDAGNAVWIWGAQLEIGPNDSSYIATAGTAATRNADVVDIPDLAWFAAGTFLAEGHAGMPNANNADFLHFRNADDSDSFSLGVTSTSKVELNVEGAVVGKLIGNAPDFQEKINMAITFSDEYMSYSLNGINHGSVNGTFILPTTFSVINVGRDQTAGKYVSGYMNRLRFWPTKLTPLDLTRMTRVR